MDRWNYARDEHPPYCTCVECIDELKNDNKPTTRRPSYSNGNIFERFIAWLKRMFG